MLYYIIINVVSTALHSWIQLQNNALKANRMYYKAWAASMAGD